MTLTLHVEKRTERGGANAEKLRDAGKIPAVVYGPKQEATAITLDKRAFDLVFAEAGESTIISLEGLDQPVETLVQDVAFNVTRGGATHVDFYAIERGKEITLDVPLEFIGEAPALKLGGVLTKALHEVEVTCRPSKIPQHIDVDVSVLVDFDSHILVKDLILPEGVKIENDSEETVALIQQVEEEKEEVAAPVDMAAIEVEKKGKDEEEAAS